MKYLISTIGIQDNKHCHYRLDDAYSVFFKKYGVNIFPVKNFSNLKDLKNNELIKSMDDYDGIIISGSGDIKIPSDKIFPGKKSKYSFERDFTENYLIEKAIKKSKKIIGVCHGMQKINEFFGGQISPYYHCNKATYSDQGIEHFVAASGKVLGNKEYIVNQYHDHCVTKANLSSIMDTIAVDTRFNTIECFKNDELNIMCMQWHPERKASTNEISIKLLDSFL